jgi:peptide chain release factor 3
MPLRFSGISISSTAMNFDYQGLRVNILNTPGHQDFSEDTYWALAAADIAIMLLDAAKGLEPQMRKLFEVC